MKTNLLLKIFVALFIISGASSCRNPQKLANSGRYDEAVEVAAKRLRKNKKKLKYVVALEQAYSKAQQRDLRAIDNLKRDGGENWDKVNSINKVILHRQNIVEPLVPLVADNGYKANITFVKVDDMLRESREKAAEFSYNKGKELLEKSEKTNDRFVAREAYYEFQNVYKYFQNYRDTKDLAEKARRAGTTYVAFRMVNNTGQVMPKDFEKVLLEMNISDLSKDWIQYDLNPNMANPYDYKIAMNLNTLEVSPEQQREREYTDEKTIEDGRENVVDQNGVPLRDSLGKPMTRPKMVRITAKVLEIQQHKAAMVGGNLEYYDASNRKLKTLPMNVESVFDNFAATFQGDRRALSAESVKKLNQKFQPFPTSPAMIMMAADKLKQFAVGEMTNNRGLIQ